MPTYEYECSKCGYNFELEQRITEEPRKRCPKCRGKVNRLVSGGGGILFKGNGFHVTDYRSSDYKRQADADKPGSGAAKKDSTSSADDA